MNLIMSKQIILPILTNIAQATANGSNKPIMEGMMFDVKDKVLTIIGADSIVNLSKQLPIECEDGCFIVSAKKFLSIIKSLPEDTIELNIVNGIVIIKSGKSKFELTVYGDKDEFPQLPEMEYQTQFTTNSVDMFNRIVNAMGFTSDDNLRAVLTAVFLESSPEGLNIVATDSVRLVKYQTNIMLENISVMLPKRAVEILKNLPRESVEISISENAIKFDTSDYTLVARLINGNYPSYRAIIPKTNDIVAICDKNLLMGSLARMSLVANPVTKLIKFMISKDSLQVSSQDSNSSSGGVEFMPCEYEGEEMTIGFNYSKLNDLLKLISSDKIRFEISQAKKPVIIKDTNDASLLTLIMPSIVE